MQNRVQWHPDGLVIVESAAGVRYVDTPENFEADAGKAFPGAGAYHEIYYRQGVKHYRRPRADSEPFMLPQTYAEYDALIGQVASLVAAKQARQAAARPRVRRYARLDDRSRVIEIGPETTRSAAEWGDLVPASQTWVEHDSTAEVGWQYDPVEQTFAPVVPAVEEIRAQKIREAHRVASEKRQALFAAESDFSDPDYLRNMLALLATATAKLRRETKGQGKPGESDVLDQLESQADAIEAIDDARDTIIAEIEVAADPAAYDVPNSPHWPSTVAGGG